MSYRYSINEKISYIKALDQPLSADVGIIMDHGVTWLYDVGNGENGIDELREKCNIVLSHFHQDHVGNIHRIHPRELYVSKETYRHVLSGTIVCDELFLGNLHIFPLPSSHARGCLGLEVDNQYAFVGDALYPKAKGDGRFYNVQLLRDEIQVLRNLRAPYLLISHFDGLVRKREDVIAELETIYRKRTKNEAEICTLFTGQNQ